MEGIFRVARCDVLPIWKPMGLPHWPGHVVSVMRRSNTCRLLVGKFHRTNSLEDQKRDHSLLVCIAM